MKPITNFKFKLLACLLLAGCVFLISCDTNKLTRDKAEKLIKEFYQYPNLEATKPKEWGINHFSERDFHDVEKLTQAGLMSCSHRHLGWYCGFTEKGGEYVAEENNHLVLSGMQVIITNCRFFNEVTGIKIEEGGQRATVDFTCKRKGVNPFGEIAGFQEGEIVDYQVKMALYDDGWRIENTPPKKIWKPEDVSFYTSSGDYTGKEFHP